MTRGAAAARPRSATSRTRASTARWSSRRSAARPTRPQRFARRGARAARRDGRGRPGARAVRPGAWRRCRASACSPCCWSAPCRVERGAIEPGDLVQVAYLFTLLAFPVRAIGWVLGELPRSVVGWDRVAQRARRDRLAGVRRPPAAPADGPAALDVDGVCVLLRRRDERVLHGVTFDVRRGHDRRARRPDRRRASPRSPRCWSAWSTPTAGRSLLDGVDVRELAAGAVAGAAALVPQQTFLFDDTVRGNVTLGRRRRRRRGLGGAAARPGRRLRRGAARRARHASASAAPRCPAGSASASRWPARWCAARGCSCSTTRPPASTRGSSSAILRRAARGGARRRPSSSSPTAGRRSRSPTRSSTSSTAGSSTAGTHDELLDAPHGYRDLVTAYERDASRAAGADRRRRRARRCVASDHAPTTDDRGRRHHGRQRLATPARSPRCAAGFALTPEFRDGLPVTLLLALVATLGRGRRADRRAADDRPRPRRPGGPDLGARPPSCCWRAAARAGHRGRRLPDERAALPRHRGRPGRRCACAAFRHVHDLSVLTQNAERRGVAGLPGHQRRRHDQHVHAVGRAACS